MSFGLATSIAAEVVRAKRQAVPKPDGVMEIKALSVGSDAGPGEIPQGAIAAGLAAGTIVLVLLIPFSILSMYLEWLRFRDGTKAERYLQIGAFAGRVVVIPAEFMSATQDYDLATWARVVLGLSSAADGASAIMQLSRSEHPVANGIALVGDASSIGAAAFGPMIKEAMRSKGMLPGQPKAPVLAPGSQVAAVDY